MGVELLNYEQAVNQLRAMNIDNVRKRKDLKKVFTKVMNDARSRIVKDETQIVGTGYPHSDGDPRHAYKAVGRSIYKRILGGNVNIFSARRRGAPTKWERPRKYPEGTKHRGGNRLPQNDTTRRMNSYEGKDRSFVVRIIERGSPERVTRYGKRGGITARPHFQTFATYSLNKAQQDLGELLPRVFNEVWQGK